MAFYTLEELELNIADQINKLVQNGYHIDGEASTSTSKRFKAVLKKDFPESITVIFRSIVICDKYSSGFDELWEERPEYNRSKYKTYYKVCDNIYTDIYADSKTETY